MASSSLEELTARSIWLQPKRWDGYDYQETSKEFEIQAEMTQREG